MKDTGATFMGMRVLTDPSVPVHRVHVLPHNLEIDGVPLLFIVNVLEMMTWR